LTLGRSYITFVGKIIICTLLSDYKNLLEIFSNWKLRALWNHLSTKSWEREISYRSKIKDCKKISIWLQSQRYNI